MIVFSALSVSTDEIFLNLCLEKIYNGKKFFLMDTWKKKIFDNQGKAVNIQLNINGKYSVFCHSCGTVCSLI